MDKEKEINAMKTNMDKDIDISYVKLQKMALLYNALEDGWSIKKNKDYYIFTKNHEGKKKLLGYISIHS